MTEAEWLASADTRAMLSVVEHGGSLRKLCLLGCAWWRRAYGQVAVEPILRVVEVAEQVADGRVSHKRLRKALASMGGVAAEDSADALSEGIDCTRWAARCVAAILTDRGSWGNRMWWGPSVLSDRLRGKLLRDVFGNPFRGVPDRADCRAFGDAAVQALAGAVYEDGDFGSLPVLADALEDAGCAEPELLAHLRSAGPHARGCWALDAVLGKG
jgi:hypothetical protein